ncbi:transmembrane and ubiquitin-like domain-containing protein 1 [Anthonomus grandis grandis]|uniref:transmembrane and ubiquitin-like domain-containing protein 1 n=1 Tax=Anthonomus grandis grandis TaxID=2921223 RepID=UPI0021658EBB|nr:transmembrane and ubiquitin-like domain-containing protein 1 [Anthonomus grandis grandis]XP_050296363.1 transmembrane and ubiquitin-like domain-containing protein 1 [Anthonomus grandis grandis]
MTLIEGIGDEVTHFFLFLFAGLIAYIAWWSTNISDQRQFRTLVLLNRRRNNSREVYRVRVPFRPNLQSLRYLRQLTNHTEAVTISEGTPSNSSTSVQTDDSAEPVILNQTSEQQASSSTEIKTESAPSSSAVQSNTEGEPLFGEEERSDDDLVELEQNEIIETMDSEAQSELRQRRLAHFANASPEPKKNAANNPLSSESPENELSREPSASIDSSDASPPVDQTSDNITIKLKYINDNIRIVDGRLEELVGDFKVRHFVDDLRANKEIKLIFNGQILKEDRHNLKSYGLFDNCVVHCLILPKRNQPNRNQAEESSTENNSQFFVENPFINLRNVNNNNQAADWDLGDFLFAAVSFILLAAWYFRYAYAHLYTITATVGLILITGIFSILVVGSYYQENEIVDGRDANVQIRVGRTERIEVQQQ